MNDAAASLLTELVVLNEDLLLAVLARSWLQDASSGTLLVCKI